MEKLYAGQSDFEEQECQVGEMKKVEEKRMVEMEDVSPVNNATLCINANRYDVMVWTGTVHKELLAAQR